LERPRKFGGLGEAWGNLGKPRTTWRGIKMLGKPREGWEGPSGRPGEDRPRKPGGSLGKPG